MKKGHANRSLVDVIKDVNGYRLDGRHFGWLAQSNQREEEKPE